MAQTLEQLRRGIITSLFGRRIGMDKDETLVGQKDIKREIIDLTTASSGTSITPYGISRVTCTGSSQGPVQYQLQAPIPGVEKVLMVGSSSTGSFQFLTTAAGASVLGNSAGTTAGVVNLIGGAGPCVVTLVGVTTAQWVMKSFTYATTAAQQAVSFTTST